MVEGDFGHLHSGKATRQLMDLDDPPTAIFVSADSAASGVYESLANRGLRVPDDVSVVGYDNVIDASLVEPRLTTVDQNFNDLGLRAVQRLLRRIDDPSLPVTHIDVPVTSRRVHRAGLGGSGGRAELTRHHRGGPIPDRRR